MTESESDFGIYSHTNAIPAKSAATKKYGIDRKMGGGGKSGDAVGRGVCGGRPHGAVGRGGLAKPHVCAPRGGASGPGPTGQGRVWGAGEQTWPARAIGGVSRARASGQGGRVRQVARPGHGRPDKAVGCDKWRAWGAGERTRPHSALGARTRRWPRGGRREVRAPDDWWRLNLGARCTVLDTCQPSVRPWCRFWQYGS